jgi:hypothetical protein
VYWYCMVCDGTNIVIDSITHVHMAYPRQA